MPVIQPIAHVRINLMPASPSDTTYPRIYKVSSGWLIFLTLFGLVLAIGGILGARFLATEPLRNPQSRMWLIGLSLVFAGFGVYCLLSTLRSRVLLYPDHIEVE